MTATTIDGQFVRIPNPPRPVNPLSAIALFYRRYFVLAGRSSCSEFWWAFAYVTILNTVLMALFTTVGEGNSGDWNQMTTDSGNMFGVIVHVSGQVIALLHVVPMVTATVRRLHDVGASGWLILVALVPVLGPVFLLFYLIRASVPLDSEFASLGYDWEDDKRFALPDTSHS